MKSHKQKMLIVTITPEAIQMETINGTCEDSDKILNELKKIGVVTKEVKEHRKERISAERVSEKKRQKEHQ